MGAVDRGVHRDFPVDQPGGVGMGQQDAVDLVPRPITAEAAVKQSGISAKFPEINLAENKIGIFGKLPQLDTVIRDKDRIEIYRPLIADPKEVRRQRAEAGKVMKKGGGDIAE